MFSPFDHIVNIACQKSFACIKQKVLSKIAQQTLLAMYCDHVSKRSNIDWNTNVWQTMSECLALL